MHIHPHLNIVIDGQVQVIPAGIGLGANGDLPIHTHDSSGTIHVESPVLRTFYLQDFFTVWGQTFTSQNILGHQVDATHFISMTVTSQGITYGTTAFGNQVLQDGDIITISYGAVDTALPVDPPLLDGIHALPGGGGPPTKDNCPDIAELKDAGWIWVDPNNPIQQVTGVVNPTEADPFGSSEPVPHTEGSFVNYTDFAPGHDSHDQNLHIAVDQGQFGFGDFTGLVSIVNDLADDHGPTTSGAIPPTNQMEIEWESGIRPSDTSGDGKGGNNGGPIFPEWAWPSPGDRVWAIGQHIYDCGHSINVDGTDRIKSEIHPPFAEAAIRGAGTMMPDGSIDPSGLQMMTLPGTGPTPVPVVATDLYIHGDGGFATRVVNQNSEFCPVDYPITGNCPINTTSIARDYNFDIPLPQRPAGATNADLRYFFNLVPDNTIGGFDPVLTPIQMDTAHPKLHVFVHLDGSGVAPEAIYARKIFAGWADPQEGVRHLQITLNHMVLHTDMEPLGFDGALSFFWLNVPKAGNEWERLSNYDLGHHDQGFSLIPPCLSHTNHMTSYDDDKTKTLDHCGDGIDDFSGPTFDFFAMQGQPVPVIAWGYAQNCRDARMGHHLTVPTLVTDLLSLASCEVPLIPYRSDNAPYHILKSDFASQMGSVDVANPGGQYDLQFTVTELPPPPQPVHVDLPAGGGTYELLLDGSDLVLRVQGGEELFRMPEALVTKLTINGSAAGNDDLQIDGNIQDRVNFRGGAGSDRVEIFAPAGASTILVDANTARVNNALFVDYSVRVASGSLRIDGSAGNGATVLDVFGTSVPVTAYRVGTVSLSGNTRDFAGTVRVRNGAGSGVHTNLSLNFQRDPLPESFVVYPSAVQFIFPIPAPDFYLVDYGVADLRTLTISGGTGGSVGNSFRIGGTPFVDLLTIGGGPKGDNFFVDSGTAPLVLIGQGGPNHFHLGGFFSPLDGLPSSIAVSGGGQGDILDIDAGTGNVSSFDINKNVIRANEIVKGKFFTAEFTTNTINVDGVGTVKVVGNELRSTTFRVHETQSGTQTVLIGGGSFAGTTTGNRFIVGDDKHNVGDMLGPVVIYGQGGNDNVLLDDRFMRKFIPAYERLDFYLSNMARGFGQVERDYTAGNLRTQTTTTALVQYIGVKSLQLLGRDRGTNFHVLATPAGVTTTIQGGIATDRFTVGDATHSLGGIQGPVTLDGGAGSDSLSFYDGAAPGPEVYIMTAGSLQRYDGNNPFVPDAALIQFAALETITLTGGHGASNTFHVYGSPAGGTVDLYGQPGSLDVFDVRADLGPFLSPVRIHGQKADRDFAYFYDFSDFAPQTYDYGTDPDMPSAQGRMTRTGMAPVTFDGLNEILVYTARAGGNTVNVRATDSWAGILCVVEPGDHMTVGNQGSLSGILGGVTVVGNTGAVLTVDDSADTMGRRATIDPPPPNNPQNPYSRVSGLAPSDIAWNFAGVSGGRVTLLGGPLNDSFVVHGTVPDVALSINGGGGVNTLDYSKGVNYPGLVAWYPGEGNANDLIGGASGTLVGNVTFAAGRVGQAFRFDGTDYVQVPNSLALQAANISVEAWVNSTTLGRNKYILAKGANGGLAASYALYTGENGLQFFVYDGGTFVASPDAGPGIWDGNWHHVVGTYDGAKVRLYVDGAEVGTGTPTNLQIRYNLPTSNDLFIGTYGDPTSFYNFNGLIDEPSVYNRALSAAEVKALYAAGSAGKSPLAGTYVNLQTGQASGLRGGIAHIQNVIGSAFDNILVGNGNNVLSGGGGRNLLIAGGAASTLYGGNGQDILIGGTTTIDTSQAALEAALAAWKQAPDYQTAVAKVLPLIRATSNGGGNKLFGGAGLDLFFASTNDITDWAAPEAIIYI
jgi:hypothetical protein